MSAYMRVENVPTQVCDSYLSILATTLAQHLTTKGGAWST